jgi:hypothetical protein
MFLNKITSRSKTYQQNGEAVMLNKNLLTIILSVLFLTNLAFANTPPADDTAVKQAIEKYAKSTDDKDGSGVESVFYKEALIYSVNKFNNKVSEMTLDEYVDGIKKGRFGGWERDLSIESVDVYGNTAVAKVMLKDAKLKQTEYLSLVKMDDGWKIVSCSLTRERA